MLRKILSFIIIIISCYSITAQNTTVSKKILYKVINNDSLFLHVFEPKTSKKPTAAIVFFFGGGWTGGSPKQFYEQSSYFASRGMLAVSAEYRIKNTHGTTPFESVEDGKSAIRWVREHAKELNINPNKIVASGGSAGGHVALCTALIDGLGNPNENLLISSIPNALVTYNPVLDTTEKGYGSKKVVGRETEISPCHQIKENMPPMLIFHGKEDTTVPFENAERFNLLMNKDGNTCELIAVNNAGHGFFNKNEEGTNFLNLTIYKTDVFLKKLKFIKGKSIIKYTGVDTPFFK